MTKVITTILASLCLFSATAQMSMQRVNKQYELKAYDLAIPGYLEILQRQTSDTEAMIMLAKSYQGINEHFEAIKWFSKAHSLTKLSDEQLLAYGHSLKAQERYTDAKKIYALVDNELSYIGSHHFLVCEKLATLQDAQGKEAVALRSNSGNADFAPEVYRDKLYFSSFRKDIKWSDQTAKNLANSAESSNHFVIGLGSVVTADQPSTPGVTRAFPLHSSPFSIAENASTVIFAKNVYLDGNRQIDGTELGVGLYQARVNSNGDWVDVRAFLHNSSEYSNNYPYITEDGSTLYFASNRPGGYGGYDLYKSVREGALWSTPINLGPAINTAGDEVTPYLDGSKLIFASDWHVGLGGQDLFSAELRGEQWSNVQNLGAPINSSLDDYDYVKLSNEDIVFVSNREGGYGDEDLYFFGPGHISQERIITEKPIVHQAVESKSQVTTKPEYSSELPSRESVTTTTSATTSTRTAPSTNMQSSLVKALDKEITLIVQDHTGNRIKDAVVDLTACGSPTTKTNEYGKAMLNTDIDCKVSIKADGYLKAIVRIADGYVNSDGKKTVVLMRDTDSDYSYGNTTSYNMGSAVASSSNESTNTSATSYTSEIEKIASSTESPSSQSYTEMSSTQSSTSYGTTPASTNFYSVQIAAFAEYTDRLNNYKHLSEYGEVYAHQDGPTQKIRVGKYTSRIRAVEVMNKLKSRGYADAFIVGEGATGTAINTSTYGTQDYTAGQYSSTSAGKHSSAGTSYRYEATTETEAFSSKYKIRLAAYSDTRWFDIDKVEDLGKIEQWTSSDYTVMVLGQISSISDAKEKLSIVKSRGFKDARIVTDEGGLLRYYKD